jgi:RNA polymerase II-associated factor 1
VSSPAIQASSQPPPVHPHDRALLRPIAALGKPKVAEANVSFLRRTEYISSLMPKRLEANHPRALLAKNRRPAKRPEPAADSPQVIKRKIDKSFEIAEQDLKDPKRVKHPSKKHLKLVDAAPLLPDLDAFPDSGAYVTIKFLTNPVSSSSEYDTRLRSGLFRPIDRTAAEEAALEAAMEAYTQDPVNNPKPANLMNYDFYLGQTRADADRFRRKFDVDDPSHDDDDLYTHKADTGGYFQFNRIRAYETAQETELDHPTKYEDEIILAVNDDTTYPKQKAVYYYPIMQKSTIRPQRTKNIARTNYGLADDDEAQVVDQLDLTVEDPTEEMRGAMKMYAEHPLGWDQEEGAEEHEHEQEHEHEHEHIEQSIEDADVDADGEEAERNGASSPGGQERSPSAHRDAEGDEDEDED